MEKEEKFSFIKNIDDCDILVEELPSIELYMDQITTLIEEKMSSNKRSEKEKLLTKTMINNYTKEGLLKSIKGKKYSKQHILQMLLIYNLKQALSISDIKALLDFSSEELSLGPSEYNPTEVTKLYQDFLRMKTAVKGEMADFIEKLSNTLEPPTEEKLAAVEQVILLSIISAYAKRAAENMIDQMSTEKSKQDRVKQ